MAKYWSQQVRPRSPEVALITLDATTKLPVGKKADQLREDGAALIHEPLSALLAFKSRQARNHFNLLPSYYLRPAPCNLTGQQWKKLCNPPTTGIASVRCLQPFSCILYK